MLCQVQSSPPPPLYCPSVHRLPPIPPPIFKSQIGFFLVIYDSFHRQFPNSAAFSLVPRSAVLGGVQLYTLLYLSNSLKPNMNIVHNLISRFDLPQGKPHTEWLNRGNLVMSYSVIQNNIMVLVKALTN